VTEGCDGDERCCFDDWVGSWQRRLRDQEVAKPVTAALLEAIDRAGFQGRTLLDLGCGVGDLGIAAVGRGAASTRGYDLSPAAVEGARRLAAERGVSERSAFEVGDAAQTELPEADVVVLNRVFCCYPNVDGLLERSLAAARTTFAFTMPRSRGPVGAFSRVSAMIGNAWYAIRKEKFRGFRVYIHDVRMVDERIRRAGFRPVVERPTRVTWWLAVYAR
jgi:magnesium-protoporphyrin O-methyltransferase